MAARRRQVLYLSHGGGPLPLLGDAGHADMVATLQQIAKEISKPSAIIVISAHWEEVAPAVTAGASPPLIYDYYGFPAESYRITYPCPGLPQLAGQIGQSLHHHGIEAVLDEHRGFDHGLFVPLKIMYPDADVPCVQLSLLKSLDPADHIRLGAALAGIDHDNLLVIGSGFSFHNLQAFFSPPTDETRSMNGAFEQWLLETCSTPDISEAVRTQRLLDWANAPHARYCHPREEHLLPLHVCYGAAGTECSKYYQVTIMNRKSSMYLWSNA